MTESRPVPGNAEAIGDRAGWEEGITKEYEETGGWWVFSCFDCDDGSTVVHIYMSKLKFYT